MSIQLTIPLFSVTIHWMVQTAHNKVIHYPETALLKDGLRIIC